MRCSTPFSVVKRKHNCRACGAVVCAKCSGQKAALAYDGGRPGRVCDTCRRQLAAEDAGDTGPTRQGVLDTSYTRGKGLLDVAATEPSLQSGELQLRCRRSWLRRWFALRANCALFMYESGGDRAALAAVPVPGFTVTWAGAGKAEPGLTEKERERAFKLTLGKRNYTLMGDSKEEVARWIAALQKASRTEVLASSTATL
ncbi:FYVE, RhoGEF and PH domain-containing protein 2-like [Pollicipes pollicipes]|uniref:FYVE, RhoGEF and PH domain-containing protein 2-like n=1 Tax=Pollicipes pollicipes TaxID=41117 RepID=UPI00188581AF|nr:FYVE, RhoGEF and PH domain-containing protein 2-like [Pollicipes pollicipes]